MILLFWLLILAAYVHCLGKIRAAKSVIDEYGGQRGARRTMILSALGGICGVLIACSGSLSRWAPFPWNLVPLVPVMGALLVFSAYRIKLIFECTGTSKSRPAEEACSTLLLCHISLVAMAAAAWVFGIVMLQAAAS